MKNAKIFIYKKGLVLSFLFFVLVSFSAVAQSDNSKQMQAEPEVSLPVVEQHDIVVRMEDENGREMKYMITREEYRNMENTIREYERQNGITDRSKNIYVVNSKLEFVKVSTLTK